MVRRARRFYTTRMTEASRRSQSVSVSCEHPELEYLGDNRGARFFHCDTCRKVYVVQAGHTWTFPALPRESANDEEN